MNLNHLRIRRAPTDGCPPNGASRHGHWIRIGSHGRPHRGARRIQGSHAGVSFERIGARGRQALNVVAIARRMIHRYLDTRIAYHEVLPKDVSLNS